MKKTYISPIMLTVQLGSRDALLQTVSAQSTLGAGYRGTTSSNSSVTEGDVKESKSVNVWDEEW